MSNYFPLETTNNDIFVAEKNYTKGVSEFHEYDHNKDVTKTTTPQFNNSNEGCAVSYSNFVTESIDIKDSEKSSSVVSIIPTMICTNDEKKLPFSEQNNNGENARETSDETLHYSHHCEYVKQKPNKLVP
ncbi:3427_t:CDS:2 [Funneliformis caledonium]|uniref:3427_t:CDS:1 n=1 Tax=Funneliformis caledonium TaxID=1117310 RepID=A0A9N8Z6N8_9GLOM|nr:3427_t:CDS:2 [Funneliformis caledonium]